jgi:acyl-CoA hydrolase
MSDLAARYPAQAVSAAEALAGIRPGRRLFIGTGCAMPQYLVRELVSRACTRVQTELLHILTLGPAPFADAGWNPHYTVNSLLMSDNVRGAIQRGQGHYSPIAFSDLPALLRSGELPIEAALIQVSPPDEDGMMSLGISVDVTRSALESAHLVIAQVNRHMPRTCGDTPIHATDVDFLVTFDEPLVEYDPGAPPPEAPAIGELLAELVDDGATIAAGLGRMISSVLPYLRGKRDLGIHTELMTQSLLELIESGAVTGSRKTLDPGKAVASFAMGSAAFYDKLHQDARFSFQSTDYVNDPAVIKRHTKMTSISSATQIDLTGQVCADSIGSEFHSGVGGIMDFNRGAARSLGGKPIVVMSATAQQGAFSRIVARLSPGAGATTTRADAHYVITEYGVAFLHAKSIQERALSLIGLAHPRYREELLEDAINAGYVHPRIAAYGSRVILAPRAARSTVLLANGMQLSIRVVRPTDESKLLRFITEHCRNDMYAKTPPAEAVFVDHRRAETILATVPAPDGEDIVAIAGYRRKGDEQIKAEAGCVVASAWRIEELAPALLEHLSAIARGRDIEQLHIQAPGKAAELCAALAAAGIAFERSEPAPGAESTITLLLV